MYTDRQDRQTYGVGNLAAARREGRKGEGKITSAAMAESIVEESTAWKNRGASYL